MLFALPLLVSSCFGLAFQEEPPEPPPSWETDDFIESLEGEFNERLEAEFGELKDFGPEGDDYIDFKPLGKAGDSVHKWNIGFSGKYKKGILGRTFKTATQIGTKGVQGLLEEINADPTDPAYEKAVRELILDILRHEWEHTCDPSPIFPDAPGGGAAPGGKTCGHFQVKVSQLKRLCERVKELKDSATEDNCLPRRALCASYKVHRKALAKDANGADCPDLEQSEGAEEWWDVGPCEWCGENETADCDTGNGGTVIIDQADTVDHNFGILPSSN